MFFVSEKVATLKKAETHYIFGLCAEPFGDDAFPIDLDYGLGSLAFMFLILGLTLAPQRGHRIGEATRGRYSALQRGHFFLVNSNFFNTPLLH